jgi:hypothetical protein
MKKILIASAVCCSMLIIGNSVLAQNSRIEKYIVIDNITFLNPNYGGGTATVKSYYRTQIRRPLTKEQLKEKEDERLINLSRDIIKNTKKSNLVSRQEKEIPYLESPAGKELGYVIGADNDKRYKQWKKRKATFR